MAGTELRVGIHGEWLRIVTDSPAVAEMARDVFAEFGDPETAVRLADDCGPDVLEAVLYGVPDAAAVPDRGSAEPVGPFNGQGPGSGYQLYRSEGRWLIELDGNGRLSLDRQAGRLEGWLVRPEALPAETVRALVRLAAIELLRLRGLHAVHAAALEKDGVGYLIAGPSGRGKTTSCLALTRAGFRCLSDDHPLLRQTAHGLELLPFRDRIDVTDRTVGFFPELRAAEERLHPGPWKRSFRLEQVFEDSRPQGCRPGYLLFPRIVDRPESHLEPLPKARALEELLPEALLVLDRELAQRQFRLLSRLVQSVACYRLHFGRDVLHLSAALDRLPLSRCA